MASLEKKDNHQQDREKRDNFFVTSSISDALRIEGEWKKQYHHGEAIRRFAWPIVRGLVYFRPEAAFA